MKKLSKTLRSRYRGLSPVPMPTSTDTLSSYACACLCSCRNDDVKGAAVSAAGNSVGVSMNN